MLAEVIVIILITIKTTLRLFASTEEFHLIFIQVLFYTFG